GDVLLSYAPADQPAPVAAAPAAPPGAAPTPAPPAPAAPQVANGPGGSHALPVKAAPSVRYLARKLGIDLNAVRGTGPQGRILIEDLTGHVRPAGDGAQAPSRPEPAPKFDYGRPGTRIKVQGLRRKTAEHMVRSKQTTPHYSYVDECDVTDLVRLRQSLKDVYARAGVKLTYLPFFVKGVVNALKEVP